MGKWDSERQLLWEVTQEMAKAGLVAGSSGNASLKLPGDRDQGLVLITPTGLPYRQLGTDDLVVIDLEGEHIEGHLLPSSETALHLAIYKEREDAGAVIHTHSLFASVAAVAGLEIPPLIDEMVISVGGSVRVAEYGFPSTEDLARKSCLALGDRNAALLRNHGMVGVGRTLWEAFGVCQLVERVAQIFTYASLMGRAIPLPPDIVEREQEMFRMQRAASLHAGGHHNTHHNNEEVD
jgi:L-fuculose-phosphate aldolase